MNKPSAKNFKVLLCIAFVAATIFFVYALGLGETTNQHPTFEEPTYDDVELTTLEEPTYDDAELTTLEEPAYDDVGLIFERVVASVSYNASEEIFEEPAYEEPDYKEDAYEEPFESRFDSHTYVLEQFFSGFPSRIAVYYHNPEIGFTFTRNGERVYFAASLTKAPFALYIYQKADVWLTDLSSAHPFLEEYYAGGSGIIRHNFEFGHYFSQHQLLAYNLFHSDNVALRMLRSIHGVAGFTRFIEGLGGDSSLIHNITYSRTTANQAGLLMRAKYDYINRGGRYSRTFLDHLLNNHYPFFESNYPVASKTGWFPLFGGAWHKMAIVYAPSPFILVILSDNYGGYDTPYFNEIVAFLEEFNRYIVDYITFH
ncbi:MAG: class A beta-lactamase-related serine hydrolase [Defluviitaleaceae bacterium]|nr:class A beta-lactamase-related serine hydrolase [Defluviitaleaceae bacterium]